MFEAVRTNRRLVQLFLVLITIPFALFGIDFYMQGAGGGNSVATVGSAKITEAELAEAVRLQQEAIREQMGQFYDPTIAEQPEFRASVLNSLINQKALDEAVKDGRVLVPDDLILAFIERQPEFQEDGKYSRTKAEAFLRSRGMTNEGFVQRVRETIAQQLLLAPVVQSAYVSKASLARWVALQEEERTVAELTVDAKAFQQQAKLAPNAAKSYYDANRANFETPERVRVEYVTLSADDLASQGDVTEADARKWYDENKAAYQQVEERRASHILISVEEKASAAEKEAAKKKAEQLLTQVKANPSAFGRIARENSQDDVSAAQGGDLGFFRRGDMVKAFEDAAFALKPQEISGLVESRYGYHIIALTEVRGGQAKPFEAVRGEITEELRTKALANRLADAAANFSDLVFTQADSLQPAASKFGLKVQQSEWLERGAPQAGVLGNAKLLAAIFSADSVKNRRNTEAIDVGNNILVSARVIDYKPVTARPFEEVKASIEAQLLEQEAKKLAVAEGQARLAKLQAGEPVTASWAAAKSVKRTTEDLSDEARAAIFTTALEKTPTYVGVEQANGFAVYRIEKASMPTIAENDPRLVTAREEYTRALAEEDVRAFVAGLRQRFDAEIRTVSTQAPPPQDD